MTTGCLATALLLMGSVCTPYTEPVAPTNYSVEQFMNERDATVVLLNPDTLRPNCSAVSVYDHDDQVVLVTAVHCLYSKVDKFDPAPNAEKEVHEGDKILYVTRNDWYYTGSDAMRATIKYIDVVRDRATLKVNQFEVPEPVPRSRPCDQCSFYDYQVHAVSSINSWERRDGMIVRATFSGIDSYFFESDLSIDFGWSGSPVFNTTGEVLGIMTECFPKNVLVEDHMVKKCKPGWSLFTSLP